MSAYPLLISMVWFNETLDETNRYVWPDRALIDRALDKWARANPNVPIMLWMYAPTCTKKQIDNTRAYLTETYKGDRIRLGNFVDICPNPEFFAARDVEIYWKVDIARYIIALTMLEQFENVCYLDLDLPAIDVSAHLGGEYARRLAYFGILYCASDNTQSGIENGFFIMSRTNRYLLEAIRFVMIDCPTAFVQQIPGRVYSLYMLSQWGFMYSSVVFLLEHMYRYPENVKIMFTGASLGVRSKFISLKHYLHVMRHHPVLMLELVTCKYFDKTKRVQFEEYPPITRAWLRFSAVSCNESTNSLQDNEYERMTRLQAGVGHAKSVLQKARAAIDALPEILESDVDLVRELYKNAVDI